GSRDASPLAAGAPLADIVVRPEARRMSLPEGALASATRASLRPDHLARRPFGCDPGKAPCDVRRRSYADARSSPSTRVGTVTVNAEPTSGLLSTVIVPFSIVTRRSTMWRPRPTPPKRRVDEPSTW